LATMKFYMLGGAISTAKINNLPNAFVILGRTLVELHLFY